MSQEEKIRIFSKVQNINTFNGCVKVFDKEKSREYTQYFDIVYDKKDLGELNILKREDYSSYRMLVAMSILGVKFYPALLENFDN